MAKKKVAKKKTRKGTAARGPKLSDWVLEDRERDGYEPQPNSDDPYTKLGGEPCADGVRAFEFLLGLEAKGWSVAKICEFARDENPGWYQTHIIEAGGVDFETGREDQINSLREAADNLEGGYDDAQGLADDGGEPFSPKFRTIIDAEVKRLRDKADELENEPEYPIVRIVGTKGDLRLEAVE